MTFRKFLMVILMSLPVYVSAQTGSDIVKCGYGGSSAGDPLVECTYSDLITGVQAFINFLIYYLATPVAVLLFGYAGFTLITSGGDPKAKTKAQAIFTNTIAGYVVMLSAWLIMKLVFGLLFNETFSLFA
jgi:hypothetical protein